VRPERGQPPTKPLGGKPVFEFGVNFAELGHQVGRGARESARLADEGEQGRADRIVFQTETPLVSLGSAQRGDRLGFAPKRASELDRETGEVRVS